MKRLESKYNHFKNDVSPWPSTKETNRTFDETFTTLSLHHPTEPIIEIDNSSSMSNDRGFPLRPVLSKQSPDKLKRGLKKEVNGEEVKIHGQALRVIKSYCKRFYTENRQTLNPQINKLCSTIPISSKTMTLKDQKINAQEYHLSFYKLKKINVVDLTRSFSEQCDKVHQKKRPASASGNKIFKIKQEIKRYNQEQNPKRNKSLNSTLDFCPTIQTLPQRRLFSPGKRTKASFPDPNFNELLSHLLHKH